MATKASRPTQAESASVPHARASQRFSTARLRNTTPPSNSDAVPAREPARIVVAAAAAITSASAPRAAHRGTYRLPNTTTRLQIAGSVRARALAKWLL